MTSELKPCPFCGGAPNRVVHNDNPDWWQYECPADGCIETCSVNPVGHVYDTQHEAAAAWNTRAVPDVPELVRYEPNHKTYPYFEMEESELGEYVRYDQAAELLAAKGKEIERLRKKLRQEFQLGLTTLERAEAAEAKLAQIKEQEPVITAEVTRLGTDYRYHTNLGIGTHPLYATPVDQTAHHATLERLIRYVDAMAGEGFNDATELMLNLFKEYDVDSAESLIKKLLTT